ncbi:MULTISPECIES: DDE transposase family protein [unclassified Meiothermus]|uniref:DDE transposase family protein n=1 Tax=unclassified Meiothermus TaxID=370471 RepID=UPI001F195B3A|nr:MULTISPECIES: DDE transposase family protein [unclassified Meiothermus]
MPEEVSGWRGSRLALRMRRKVVCKATGEVREEAAYALTSLGASARELYALWRGHWGVENRLHHKRDTVFGEDASRSRKGAAGLMYLRDVILSLLHLKGWPVLRSVRRFSVDPHPLLQLIQGS